MGAKFLLLSSSTRAAAGIGITKGIVTCGQGRWRGRDGRGLGRLRWKSRVIGFGQQRQLSLGSPPGVFLLELGWSNLNAQRQVECWRQLITDPLRRFPVEPVTVKTTSTKTRNLSVFAWLSIGRIKGLLDIRKTRWRGAAAERVVELGARAVEIQSNAMCQQRCDGAVWI